MQIEKGSLAHKLAKAVIRQSDAKELLEKAGANLRFGNSAEYMQAWRKYNSASDKVEKLMAACELAGEKNAHLADYDIAKDSFIRPAPMAGLAGFSFAENGA